MACPVLTHTQVHQHSRIHHSACCCWPPGSAADGSSRDDVHNVDHPGVRGPDGIGGHRSANWLWNI
eukprot:1155798-Pelagomonas_calceolata.AAC.2